MILNKCVVLLSTYNGELFIENQIKSILSQKDVLVTLYIRDDGSTDNTVNIIKSKFVCNNVFLREEKNIGIVKSFFMLIEQAPEGYDFYSLADQDDLWDDNKLSIAINILRNNSHHLPSMYCSNQRLINQSGYCFNKSVYGEQILNHDINRLLLSNIATGCTVVFNHLLRDLFLKFYPDENNISTHDHWLALLAEQFGNLYYDINPHISYRQHSTNQIGIGYGWRERIRRLISRGFVRNYKVLPMINEFLKVYFLVTGEQFSESDLTTSDTFIKRLWFVTKTKLRSSSFFETAKWKFLYIFNFYLNRK